MEKNIFYERFEKLLSNYKSRYELKSDHDAFIIWFAEHYYYLDPIEVKKRIVNDSKAEGIDAFLIEPNKAELIFIAAKTVKSSMKMGDNFPENDIKSTLHGFSYLLTADYKGKITPALENLTDEFHELVNSCNYKVCIVFLTMKNKPVSNKFIEDFTKKNPNIKVEFWDIDQIISFYEDRYLILEKFPPKVISFELVGDTMKWENDPKAVIFSCKGRDLARTYEEHKESIFLKNVRYDLGRKLNNINRAILETASDTERSYLFWYFNNGITLICDKIELAPNNRIIRLINAQIINGAQTTYALHEAYRQGILNEKVFALIKAIEIPPEYSSIIESIALYTNSQNPIKLRDLCSNDKIQIRIQKTFLDTYNYFFERKRGEFEKKYPTDEMKKCAFGKNYKDHIIDNEEAAQAFLSLFLDKPAQAKSEKNRIFLKDKSGFYDLIFNWNDKVLEEKLLLSWKLQKYVENKRKEYQKLYKKIERKAEKDSKLGIKSQIDENKRDEIYDKDFILHSEYFVLNLLKDFLSNAGYNLMDKDNVSKLLEVIDNNPEKIDILYDTVISLFTSIISKERKKLSYYHNKFFKSDGSLTTIRLKINEKPNYNFVKLY